MGRFIGILLNAAIAAWCIYAISTNDIDQGKWYFAFKGALGMWCIYDAIKDTYRSVVGE